MQCYAQMYIVTPSETISSAFILLYLVTSAQLHQLCKLFKRWLLQLYHKIIEHVSYVSVCDAFIPPRGSEQLPLFSDWMTGCLEKNCLVPSQLTNNTPWYLRTYPQVLYCNNHQRFRQNTTDRLVQIQEMSSLLVQEGLSGHLRIPEVGGKIIQGSVKAQQEAERKSKQEVEKVHLSLA